MKLSRKVFPRFSRYQPILAEQKVLPVKETVISRERQSLSHPALLTLVLEKCVCLEWPPS